jgi:hypothetical protein
MLSTSLSGEEVEQALEDEIASLLGIHEGNVQVNITDGVVYYTVVSDNAELAQDIQDVLDDPESSTLIDDAIESIDVASVNVDEEIIAEVIVTVDTSGAENNLENAAETLEQSFQNQGFDAEAENVFITAAPSFIPSRSRAFSPVTTIPSAIPTITGTVASVSISGATTEDY